jgi:hypothetical protein
MPRGNVLPDAGTHTTVAFEELSVTVGAEYWTDWLVVLGATVSAMFAGHAIAGGVVSLTVTAKEHCDPLPVQVTFVVPTGKNEPEVTGLLLFAVQLCVVLHADVTLNGTLAPKAFVAFVPVTMGSGQVIVHGTEASV